MIKFIDISKHQGNIDVKTVIEKNGLSMVVLKVSEGNVLEDSMWKTYVKQIPSNVKRGFYHFARPDLGNSAEAEAKAFLSIIKGTYTSNDVLVLDYEVNYSDAKNWCKKFMDYVNKNTSNQLMWIYANRSQTQSLGLDKLGYGIWCADYGSNDGKQHAKPQVSNLEAWQYSSRGRLSGYGGDLDVNESFVALSTSGGTTSEPKKSNSQIADEVIAGKWGNGTDRKKNLEKAGYDYDAVQKEVNKKLGTTSEPKKSNSQIADEVIAGKWGNMPERKTRLEKAGYDYNAVQKEVNKKLS